MTPNALNGSGAPRAAPWTAVAALGIVFGDLGTSPLYTMQTIVGSLGGQSQEQAALGVLSLIFWTLLITISVKYCLFVMRADNQGEGGILALMSLVGMNDWRRGTYIGATMGLLGAALIYGDGVITPSISVLSALEGVNVATTALKPFILPLGIAILVALFAVQRFGTAVIGKAFGPIMLLWFVAIGVLGLVAVVHHPRVLEAVNPWFALRLLLSSGPGALVLLGGVFLCATGGEALYADMGHFGRLPIRLAWYAVALPSLLLSYAGQCGLLLDGAPKGINPFFLLAPHWAVIPLVILATLATIIASQAIITGAFSMTRQAMQLGWLPGFNIRQTSDKVYGQIYVPAVNAMMAVGTIAITLAFRSSDRLAGAYGTAVSTTMVLTTLLLFRAMHHVWRWPMIVVAPLSAIFILVDLSFFTANLAKIVDGGWVPLTLGICIFIVMVTWRTGTAALRAKLATMAEPVDQFLEELKANRIPRVPGVGVFLTRTDDRIPSYISDHVRNTGSLHQSVVILNLKFEEQPRIFEDRRDVEPIVDGLSRVTLRYGFFERPDVPNALKSGCGLPSDIDIGRVVFFGTRDLVTPGEHSWRSHWRYSLFALLYKNAARIIDRFDLPPTRTVEVTRQIKI
ncbi:KUP/HAK/KT family potassium transporter [Caulobacter sp. S45]|uniref:potassium transporter Kup n=1 Tax=Caulobacter sp. S45 TaxID=1641861 RepID=UPI00131B8596